MILFAGTNVIPSFEIYSNTGSQEANYPVSLTNTITINGSQDQGSTTSFTAATVDLTVEVSNPCKTTTIGDITFDTSPVSFADGLTTTSLFSEPTDGVDTANGLKLLCGAKTYAVTDNADNSALTGSWAIVRTSSTAGKMELYVDSKLYPTTIAANVVKTLRVTTKFADWSTNAGSTSTVQVTITTLSCDCSAMVWTAPTLQTVTVNVAATLDLPVTQVSSNKFFPAPVSSDAAKSTNAAFNACWEASTPCVTTGSYASANVKADLGSGILALPGGWLAFDNGNQKLTIAPTISIPVGEYKVYATYTSTSGTPTEFQIVELKVDCVVTGFTRPADPTGSGNLTYKLFYSPLVFDFNLDWVQAPACAHAFTDTFVLTGTNTYIVQDAGSPGRISVETSLKAAEGTYPVTVSNSATVTKNSAFLGGSSLLFAPADSNDKVSFSVIIVDPCKTTTVNAIVMTSAGTPGSYTLSIVDGAT